MKIFIAGSTGLLGRHLTEYLSTKKYDVVSHGFSKNADIVSDLTIPNETMDVLDNVNPDVCINLICLSNVDKNEQDPNLAYRLNVLPIENICEWKRLRSNDCKIIQISTDHLYDGDGINSENMLTMRNTYVLTKYAAELIAKYSDSLILRTNFFGKSRLDERSSFSDWAEDAIRNKKEIKLFDDVYFSPLWIQTLVEMIEHAFNNFVSGIYNLGSHGGMSKAGFIQQLSKVLNIPLENTQVVSVDSLGLVARRPKGMMMNVEKFENTFNVTLPALETEIKNHINKTYW